MPRSLKCLQVNQGAIENLGYSQDEFTDINLLDIFTDLRPSTHLLNSLRHCIMADGNQLSITVSTVARMAALIR